MAAAPMARGGTVTPFPVTVARRAYLDREALRIAAGVRGASVSNVARQVYLGARAAGAGEDDARREADRAAEWIAGRLRQIEAVCSTPPPRSGGRPCASA